MKIQIHWMVFATIIMLMFITACSSNATSTTQTQRPIGTPDQFGERELSEPMRLALGILKLEDTDLAITADQANDLLMLWQAYQSMSNSETTAEVELDALIAQIRETLTTEQQQAINQMQLTMEDMANLFQSLGLEMGMPSQPMLQQTPGANFPTPQARGEGGPMMGGPGGPPGEGMFMMPPDSEQGQATLSPSLQATRQAMREMRQKYSLNPMLLNALIELLKSKVQGTPTP